MNSNERPLIPDDAVACEFSWLGKDYGVYVDVASQNIHFHNCFVPSKLFPSTEGWFSFPVSDIRFVYNTRQYKGGWVLMIGTSGGGARISRMHTDYSQLYATLTKVAPPNDPGYLMSNPVVSFLSAAGVFILAACGLFAGWFLSPPQSNDMILGVCVTSGIAIGVVGGFVIISIIDRFLKAMYARN
ncbi:hypothetical protein CA13_01130 [Planctomycetes bacterium CA13]|uniref:Uncharacterized protein n=1 Tax=Novipirellula herctigrandis TaxID=2527986 RepID=A0A5C5YVD1_9BACT|nr:hypothetical protein CA13_01130 [Planctomycetes bacterium CA13]